MTARHPGRGGNRDAKQWQAVWIRPDGKEGTKAFRKQSDAQKYAEKMEADATRGEYIDPRAAKEMFGPLAETYLRLRRKRDGSKPGESTRIRNESVYRNHVAPAFADKLVQAIKASDIAKWLDGPMSSVSAVVRQAAFLIVAGAFDLAVDDKIRRDNPARAKSVTAPKVKRVQRKAWDLERALDVRDELLEPYRLVVDLGAGLGARQGEVFAVSPDDFDHEAERAVIQRQVRRVGSLLVFKLPKGGKTRTVPLPRGLAAAAQTHMAKYPPVEVTLPWMDEEGALGAPVTVRLLLTWQPSRMKRVAGQCLQAGNFNQDVWKPALSRLGIIPEPVRTEHRVRVYKVDDAKHNGMHALRHVYEGMLGDGGVSLAGQMEFLGHSREGQGVTLGVYGNATPETFERAREAVDSRLYKLRSVDSRRTQTDLRAVR